MGDGADMALDNAWDDWEQREEWINKGRNPVEGYELGILNELGGEEADSRLPSRSKKSLYTKTDKRKATSVECKYCGKKNLNWQNIRGKWRLYDEKIMHMCANYNKINYEKN